jgi:hypothetical protein
MMMAEMMVNSMRNMPICLRFALDALEQYLTLHIIGIDRHVAPAGDHLGHAGGIDPRLNNRADSSVLKGGCVGFITDQPIIL